MESRWLFHVEGVNFESTVEDTDDLSTLRGGSLALLRLPEGAAEAVGHGAKIVDIGASRAVFTVPTAGHADPGPLAAL